MYKELQYIILTLPDELRPVAPFTNNPSMYK